MKFSKTPLEGAYLIGLEKHEDERGFFTRTFCANEFEARGLMPQFIQCNLSYNRKRGTIRGMHYQHPPYGEAKLVQCIRGELYDVIIDLRPLSKTYRQTFAVHLAGNSGTMLYIPEGFAHGFQTLHDETEVLYYMSSPYKPEAAAGIRWNDPSFSIVWPLDVKIISERDRHYPDYREFSR